MLRSSWCPRIALKLSGCAVNRLGGGATAPAPRPRPSRALTCPHVPSRALTCPHASRAPPSFPSQPYSRQRDREEPSRYRYKTKLVYRVDITPKGLVPIPALEWRIREDVPSNLAAVKQA